MKATRYILIAAAAVLALACTRERIQDDWDREVNTGEVMRFGVDLSSTKSVFVGDSDDLSTQLQWRGDETITVVSCPAAFLSVWGNESVAAGDFSAIHFGNYPVQVDPLNPALGTVVTDGTYRDWAGGENGNDSDQYAFMAWTPAIGLAPALGEENGYFTACEVPSSQPDADYSKYQILYASDLHIPTSDNPNPYVFTRAEILGGASVNFAEFKPATSMIRFRMKSGDGNSYNVSKIVIQSEDGCPIAGKAGLQPDDVGFVHAWSHFYPTQTDQNSSRIVIPFTESISVGPEYGDWYFAVVIPCAATGNITFTAYDGNDKEILYAEKVAPAGGFEAGCRHKVQLEMVVPPTDYFYVPSGDITLPHGDTQAVFTVASYHLDLTTGVKTTLPFEYEGAYLDPECTYKLPENAPRRYFQGFMIHADDTSLGIEPLSDGLVRVTVPVKVNLNDVVLASDYAGATATLRGRAEVGSSSSPVDLADGNTANTYVVTAPGWYSIPLVYGNAIKGGVVNSDAYSAFSSQTGINSPYITEASSAYVIWTDAYVPFDENVTRDEVINYGNTRTIESDLSLQISGNNNNKKLVFHLPQEGIDQGNLVIGVKNASGTTLWSWQIWVRDTALGSDDFSVSSGDADNPYYFMQCPLGCSRPAMAKVTTVEGVMYVKWKQQGTEKEFVVKTFQQGHPTPFYRRYSPTSANYQWGRKDPYYYYNSTYFANSDEGTNAPKLIPGAASSGYTGSGFMYEWNSAYHDSMVMPSPVSYVQGIANPYTSYGTNADTFWYAETTAALWDGSVKTIFDPCPAGYRIPTEAAMTQLSSLSGTFSSLTVGEYEYTDLVYAGLIFNPAYTMISANSNGSYGVSSGRPGGFWVVPSDAADAPRQYEFMGASATDTGNYRNLILPVRE